MSAKTDFRIHDGGPLSGTWKLFAGVGALGLAGAAAGYTQDPTRFAYAYLFGFMCFLTIALGALFFVLIQYATKAGWSISVRRTAEFMMSGLPIFAVLVLPVFASMHVLYPWTHDAAPAHGEHASAITLEREAHAQEPHGQGAGHATAPEEAAKHGVGHGAAEPPTTAGDHGAPVARDVPSAGATGDEELERAEHAVQAAVLSGKSPYLNKGFFFLRAIFYFLVWGGLAVRLFKLSTDQDKAKRPENTVSAQAISPIGLMLFALSITFAGIDWIMALDPMWYSTMWGVQIFAGAVVSSYAVLILITLSLHKHGLVGDAINVEHFHDLGKLQFGFIVFWAYISFSQFFLIWYSNLPEETTFYHRRWSELGGSWKCTSWAIFIVHFVVPFLTLLSRNAKRRVQILAVGVSILLAMHFVEMYWIVMPNLGALAPHWIDAACFLGVGGAYFAWVFRVMTKHALVPVGDPRLDRALHFEQV